VLGVGSIHLRGRGSSGLLFGLDGERITRIETFMNRVDEA
jgi:hypothetical protein